MVKLFPVHHIWENFLWAKFGTKKADLIRIPKKWVVHTLSLDEKQTVHRVRQRAPYQIDYIDPLCVRRRNSKRNAISIIFTTYSENKS